MGACIYIKEHMHILLLRLFGSIVHALACQMPVHTLYVFKKWLKTLPIGGDLSIIMSCKETSGQLRELLCRSSAPNQLEMALARGYHVKHLVGHLLAGTAGSTI